MKKGTRVKVPNGLGSYEPATVVDVDESRGVALVEYDSSGQQVGYAIKAIRVVR